jgi:hypothetical protein
MENQEKTQTKNAVDTTDRHDVEELDLSAENTLIVISYIVLIVGIISTMICLATIVYVDSGKYSFLQEKVFNPTGLAISLGILLFSVTICASLIVLSNISVSLKQINSKK